MQRLGLERRGPRARRSQEQEHRSEPHRTEPEVQAQVVHDLQAAGEQERRRSRRGPHRQARDGRRRRLGEGTHARGETRGRGALLGRHQRDREGLSRRHVHLGQHVAREQECRRAAERGHERHAQQQQVRRQVREDHRVQQPHALGDARGREERQRRHQVRAEEESAERLRPDAEADVEPVREQALHDEAACERVEALQARELQDGRARAPEPQRSRAPRRHPVVLAQARREHEVERGEDHRGSRVRPQHQALRLHRREPALEQRTQHAARGGGAERRREEREHVVPAEHAHHRSRADGARQERLFHRRERAGVLPVRAERPEHGAQEQQPGAAGGREQRAPDRDQRRRRRHHPRGAQPRRERGHRHREQRVLDHGGGEDGADGGRGEAALGQVQREDHGEPAERERAERSSEEDQPAVGREVDAHGR